MVKNTTFKVFLWEENLAKRTYWIEKIQAKFPFLIYDDHLPEYVFCFGGDGTFIAAMRQFLEQPVKLLFILEGNLGFLANFSNFNEIVLDNNYEQYNYLLITTQQQSYQAINEVTFYAPYTNSFQVSCNDLDFYTFRGNGCSFTTMIGSTGLNRSNGGPLLMLNGVIFSEISPLNYRNNRGLGQSVVFPVDYQLKLKVTNYQQQLQIQLDNNLEIPQSDEFLIQIRQSTAQILKIDDLKTRLQKIKDTFF